MQTPSKTRARALRTLHCHAHPHCADAEMSDKLQQQKKPSYSQVRFGNGNWESNIYLSCARTGREDQQVF